MSILISENVGKDVGELSAPQMRVARHIRNWIDEGTLRDGDALPSERVLAQEFQVTRGTVRRALEKLTEDGVLKNGRAGRRLVVIPETESESLMADTVAVLTYSTGQVQWNHHQHGWLEYIGDGALQAVREAGLHGLALQPDRLAEQGIQKLIAGKPRGVVIADTAARIASAYSWAHELSTHNIATVVFGDSQEAQKLDRVESDHEAGGYQLTQWLMEQGCERILQIWPILEPRHYWLQKRNAGYKKALREAGLKPLEPLQIPSPPEPAEFIDEARMKLGFLAEHITGRSGADALMVHTDGDYHVIAAACRMCAREPQNDIAIVGYDNYWADAPSRPFESSFPLATVDKNNDALGNELVKLLFARVAEELPQSPQCSYVEPKLIIVDKGGGT